MWFKIGGIILLVLLNYVIIVYFILNKSYLKFFKKKVKDQKDFEKTIIPSKAVQTIKIKAVKKKNDNLPIITNSYKFTDGSESDSLNSEIDNEVKPNDHEPEELPQLEVEMTINDESTVAELSNNDEIRDVGQMGELLQMLTSDKGATSEFNLEDATNELYNEEAVKDLIAEGEVIIPSKLNDEDEKEEYLNI